MRNLEHAATNVSVLTRVHKLLRSEQDVVFSDSGYTEVMKRNGMQNLDAALLFAETSPVIRGMNLKKEQREARSVERSKASMRAKVESPFRCDQVSVWQRKGVVSRHREARIAAVRVVKPMNAAPARDAGGGIRTSAGRESRSSDVGESAALASIQEVFSALQSAPTSPCGIKPASARLRP